MIVIDAKRNAVTCIGRLGENEARVIRINVSPVIRAFPGAAFTVLHRRPGDADAYPVNSSYVTMDGENVMWTVQSGDLAKEGAGQFEVRASVGDTVVKTLIYNSRIDHALDGSGTPPEPWESWVEDVEAAADRAEAAAELLENPGAQAETLEPGSSATASYSDGTFHFGIPQGEKGDPGDPGDPGEPGQDGYSPTATVTKSGSVATITITDKNGTTTAEISDGTSGGGGTSDYSELTNKPQINSVTLSGNKSLSDLGIASASDCSAKYTKPSGGIPSTDMASGVTTSLGKADTAYQKPSGGIPASDLASGVLTSVIDDTAGSGVTNKTWSANKLLNEIDGVYTKPSGGIPSSDMASAVQTSLGKADTAYQKPSGGIPGTDLADSYIEEPSSDGTNGQVLTTDGNGGRSWTTVSVTVDSALSDSSTNPVQNKVITGVVNKLSQPKLSRNIYNGEMWATNGYFQDSGNFVADNGYRTTAPVYLEAGNYMFNVRKGSVGSSALKVFVVNSTGETVSSVVQGTDSGLMFNEETNIVTFTLQNACYTRFNMASARYASSFMIVKGNDASTYPTTYIPYSEGELELKSTLGLTDQMVTEVEALKLVGKKLSVNGDSICYGEGYTGGYAKIIGDTYGMTIQNVAVSGGTITAETYSGSSARHWISRTITSMASDADYAIIEGGVNDAALTASISLGALTNDFSSTLDDTTYLGALESTLKQLTIRFAGKKYGFIIVHKASTNFSNMGSDNSNWYWATRHALEKWGVPYLDLNVACPPFGLVSQQYSADLYALTTAYTKNGDGWHPNEAGYKKYYVPKIVAWMCSL